MDQYGAHCTSRRNLLCSSITSATASITNDDEICYALDSVYPVYSDRIYFSIYSISPPSPQVDTFNLLSTDDQYIYFLFCDVMFSVDPKKLSCQFCEDLIAVISVGFRTT